MRARAHGRATIPPSPSAAYHCMAEPHSDVAQLLAVQHSDRPAVASLDVDAVLDAVAGAGNVPGRFHCKLFVAAAIVNTTYTFNALLPIFILPRLSLSDADASAIESVYFGATFIGTLLFGLASDMYDSTAHASP